MYSFRLGPLRVPFAPFDLNEGLLVVDASEKLGTLISELRTPSTGVTPVSQMFHLSCGAAIKWGRWQGRIVKNRGR
jgi:hypothetical protein